MQPTTTDTAYPLSFRVDYPERPLDRLTTFFRPIVALPILIVLATVSGRGAPVVAIGGLLVLPPLLMIVFRQKYPRWWFDWNREMLRFSNRVGAYILLMQDRYPSTDEEQYVHLEVDYPDAGRDVNR